MNNFLTAGIMPPPASKVKIGTASARALHGIWTILLTAFIIASLYLARDILIPVVLAALLTFLLSPIVSGIERRLGRVGAVLVVVTCILGDGNGWWMDHYASAGRPCLEAAGLSE